MNIPDSRKLLPIIRQQQGYTLVEILVAVVLGLILTAAVIQSYSATRQTYRITEGVSRVQENARFAVHFLLSDLREAGFSGCLGSVRNKLNGDPRDYVSFNSPITGWNYLGTESGDTPFSINTETLDIPSSRFTWERNLAGVTENMPEFLGGRVVAGSDVLYFKNFEILDITIKNHNDQSSSIVTAGEHGVADDSIMLVGDCSQVELFQHLSQGDGTQVSLTASGNRTGVPGNRRTGPVSTWARVYGPNDNFYGFVHSFYYIGEGASGLPSLFRFQSQLPFTSITTAMVAAESEELVEGVETLQILYGEDLDDDDVPNKYVSANEVTDWDNISAVRVGFLIRSPAVAADEDQATNFTLLDSIELTHESDDSFLRYAVNTTVKPRNRGLDDNLNYYICDAWNERGNEPDNGIDTCPDPG
jgi:type IV pilus assembly protein PilW